MVDSADAEINSLPHVIIAKLDENVLSPSNDYCLQYTELTQAIKKDVSYKKLQHWFEKNFPIYETQLDQNVQEFLAVRETHSQKQKMELFLMNYRIVIPKLYRKPILHLLHTAHLARILVF